MAKMKVHYIHTEKGFTLIELLIGLAILGIALFSVFTFFISQHKVDATNQRYAKQQQQAMYLMDILVKDIRNAGYNHTASSSDPDVKTAESRKIRFFIGSNSSVTYEWMSSEQKIYQTNSTFPSGRKIFSDLNITTLSFKYYNSAGTELTAPVTGSSNLGSIRRVDIYVEVQPDTTYAAGATTAIPFSVSVRPRNLGLE